MLVYANLQFVKIAVSAKHSKLKHIEEVCLKFLESPQVPLVDVEAEWPARRGLGLLGAQSYPQAQAGAETQPSRWGPLSER